MKNTDIVLNHKLFNKKINKIEDDDMIDYFHFDGLKYQD